MVSNYFNYLYYYLVESVEKCDGVSGMEGTLKNTADMVGNAFLIVLGGCWILLPSWVLVAFIIVLCYAANDEIRKRIGR